MKKYFQCACWFLMVGLLWLSAHALTVAQTVTNQTTSATFSTIQAAINAASSGDKLVLTGAFDELVTISKSLTLDGQNNATVTYTGAVVADGTTTPTLFKVAATGVTITKISFTVNVGKIHSAIHTSGNCTNLTINGNTITPTGTAPTSNDPSNVRTSLGYGRRNAIAINPSITVDGYTNVGAGFAGVLVQNNTVNGNGGVPVFRAAVHMDLCGGSVLNNTMLSVNHDFVSVFANQGDLTIQGNNCYGGGIQVAEFNSGAGNITVSGNVLDGSIVQPNTGALLTSALMRLRNNSPSSPKVVTVSNNTFRNHRWGASVENFNTVTFSGNTFTPQVNSTDFRHISFNTKLITSNSATFSNGSMIPVGATLINNTFNGSGILGGTAIAFFKHRTEGASIGTYTLGTPGNENSFNANIQTFLRLDNSVGPSSGFVSPFSEYALPGSTPTPSTTMGYWTPNLDATNNKFDVGTGLKSASALNTSERATLDARLFDKKDDANVGLITYFQPVRNVTQNTSFGTIQAAINAATAGDVIELAEYTFTERATINKRLTLRGVSKTGTIIDGTTLTDNGNGITLSNNVSDITIQNLTLQKQKGAPNSPVGNGIYGQVNNNLTITNVVSVSNAGHGVYLEATGTLTNVSVTNSTLSFNGVGGAGRGFIIFNQLKQNITVSNNLVQNNGLTGIDINDGTVAGVTITNNTVTDNGDAGISVLGAKSDGGANLVSGNTVTDNGRFGLEVKSSIGNGATSGNGSLVIENNIITRTSPFTPTASSARDLAGIAIIRRAAGSSIPSPETPVGYIVRNNTVSGFVNPGAGDGFGIVAEGINYVVTGNTVTGNEVGIQEQQTLPNERGRPTGDSPQGDGTDYFDRGNSYAACGVVSGNNVSGNSIANTRRVGPAAFSVVASAVSSTVCVGQTVGLSATVSSGTGPYSYLWTAPSGASVSPNNAQNTTATVSTAGVKSFSVTATDNVGCVASGTVDVTGKNSAVITTPPPAATAVCAGTTVKVGIVATDATGYQWYKNSTALTDGGSVSGATTATLTIANAQAGDAGTYYVVALSNCGNATSSNYVLTINPLPQATLTNNSPLSANNSPVRLTAGGGSVGGPFTYAFSAGATQQGSSNIATVITSGTFSVTVTSNQGCSSVASTTVTGANSPTVCRGGSATINLVAAGTPVRYEWYQNVAIGAPLSDNSNLYRGTTTPNLTIVNAQTNSLFYARAYYANGSSITYGPFRTTVDRTCNARIAASVEPGTQLDVRLLGNPVTSNEVRVEIRGAGQQQLMLRLVDTQGRVISSQDVPSAGTVEEHRMAIGQQAGVYLLRVSTPSQQQTVRILKSNE